MYTTEEKDQIHKYWFDSFPDSFLFVNYNFIYLTDDALNTEDYDIDILSITAGDSSVDLQFLLHSKMIDRIVNNILDFKQEELAERLDEDGNYE